MKPYTKTDVKKLDEFEAKLSKRVHAGIRFLDERKGKDWVFLIDARLLKLDLGNVCVTGQVFGSYEKFKIEYELDDSDAIKLGFYDEETSVRLTKNRYISGFDLLTYIWIEKINNLKKRRK